FARRLLAFSSAYIGNTLLGWAFAFLSKWLVNVFVSLEETGVFSFAMQISQMLFLLITTFNLVLSPYLATMWVQGERRQAAQILHLTSKVTLLGLIAGALAMQIGANLVIPRWMPEYAGALPLIRILLAAQLCNASVWTYGQYANLLERPNLKMMATGLGLALFVATSLHLGPKMGALGVAWSYLAAYAAVLAVTLWYTLRVGLALERSVALAAAAPCFLAIPTYVGMALVAAGLLAAAAWTPWILNAEEKAVVVQLLRRQNRKDGVEEAKGQKDQRAP
ncbi:MAG: lipopolysaccharide biosynthesis protein, partial [Candidatus Sumerlaeota bacterium]|nr:lipopolysaccharide biosynthesis protein [Candidatus Sumerlaeota bacterium]